MRPIMVMFILMALITSMTIVVQRGLSLIRIPIIISRCGMYIHLLLMIIINTGPAEAEAA